MYRRKTLIGGGGGFFYKPGLNLKRTTKISLVQPSGPIETISLNNVDGHIPR